MDIESSTLHKPYLSFSLSWFFSFSKLHALKEKLEKKYPELIEQNIDNDLNIRCILEGIRNEIGYNPMGIQFLIKNNQKTISHPYFIEYEDLREICLKILREEALSIWEAGKERTKSILFYFPDLW